MGGNRDPLGRNKELLAIRKRMARQLKICNVFTDLSPELDKKLAEAAEYHDFRRIENEREIESIKAALAPCIFDDNVGVPDRGDRRRRPWRGSWGGIKRVVGWSPLFAAVKSG